MSSRTKLLLFFSGIAFAATIGYPLHEAFHWLFGALTGGAEIKSFNLTYYYGRHEALFLLAGPLLSVVFYALTARFSPQFSIGAMGTEIFMVYTFGNDFIEIANRLGGSPEIYALAVIGMGAVVYGNSKARGVQRQAKADQRCVQRSSARSVPVRVPRTSTVLRAR